LFTRFTDVAVRCVTALVDRGTWLAESSSPEGVADQQIGAGQRSVESVIPQGKSPGPLPSSIATALTEDRNTLTEPEARELVARFGVPLVEAELCSSEESAVVAVERLRGPAAVKLVATDVAHKTEVGGVALNVMGAEETIAAFRRMKALCEPHSVHAGRAPGVAESAISHPAITEIDVNPVFAYPDRAVAVDVKAFLSEV
jgi:acyl-CoA synthetase (NDP forming)